MKIVVGLGNPGKEYAATRHNVGFWFADLLHDKLAAATWRDKYSAAVAEAQAGGEKILLVKPLTYMNESGLAVRQIMDFYKLSPGDLLVVHDDMDLPTGTVRIRAKGSSGGHNGIKSVIAHIKSEEFARFRIGIGHPTQASGDTINHVLTAFNKDDAAKIKAAVEYLVPAAECFFADGINAAMNRYNPRKQKNKKDEKAQKYEGTV